MKSVKRGAVFALTMGICAGISLAVAGTLYVGVASPYGKGVLIGIIVGALFFRKAALLLLGSREARSFMKPCGVAAAVGAGGGIATLGLPGVLLGATGAVTLAFVLWIAVTRQDQDHGRKTDGCERVRATGGFSTPELVALGISLSITALLAILCARQQHWAPIVFPDASSKVHIVAIWESVSVVLVQRDEGGNVVGFSQLTVPYWHAIPISLLPALLLYGYRRWRRKRHSPGRCRNCGYMLRGLRSGRCPECGALFDPKVLAALGESRPAEAEDSTG